jgi:hypothetical protein
VGFIQHGMKRKLDGGGVTEESGAALCGNAR